MNPNGDGEGMTAWDWLTVSLLAGVFLLLLSHMHDPAKHPKAKPDSTITRIADTAAVDTLKR